jgi:hypothetical protein
MKRDKTKKAYERYLNEIYADAFSISEAEDNFIYLAKTKNATSRLKTIHNAYYNHVLGSLLRKNDHIAFNVGYNEWSK